LGSANQPPQTGSSFGTTKSPGRRWIIRGTNQQPQQQQQQQQQQQHQPQNAGGSLFGSTNTGGGGGGGLFGSNVYTTPNQGGVFLGSTPANAVLTGLFSGNKPTYFCTPSSGGYLVVRKPSNTNSLFGGQSTAAQPGSSLFGQPQQQQQPHNSNNNNTSSNSSSNNNNSSRVRSLALVVEPASGSLLAVTLSTKRP